VRVEETGDLGTKCSGADRGGGVIIGYGVAPIAGFDRAGIPIRW